MLKADWKTGLKIVVAAAVAAMTLKAFLVTSCFIPSSGMENSLYQGEGVLVEKWSYGPRVPFPSVFGYHRIASLQAKKGDIMLFNNPSPTAVNTAVEQRNVFIGRCVGAPGDTMMLNNELMNTGCGVFSPDSKSLYAYPASKEDLLLAVLEALGITNNRLISYTNEGDYIRSFSHYEYYLISQKAGNILLRPLNDDDSKDVHPFIVPAKGKSVKIYPWNVVLMANTIFCHEGHSTAVKNDTLWVDGKRTDTYTFSKDYYWVSSNNPVNLVDSRLFGFVPEDCIIGKAWRIWFTMRKGRLGQRVQ